MKNPLLIWNASKIKMFGKLLIFLLLVFTASNILDAISSRRSFLAQIGVFTLITAPLNAATHLSTPKWLRDQLAVSGILKPTTALFPNLLRLREAIPSLKQEALQSMKSAKPIYKDQFFNGLGDDGWKRVYIKWHGPIDPLARQLCPETSALIESMPEVHVAMFSILMPQSKIRPHHGPAKMCLRYHLGLSTPNDDACNIILGGEKYSWRDGQDVMFDDTLRHEVVNATQIPRIVLFLDVERPQEGVLSGISKLTIRHLGPLTTRQNENNETASRLK